MSPNCPCSNTNIIRKRIKIKQKAPQQMFICPRNLRTLQTVVCKSMARNNIVPGIMWQPSLHVVLNPTTVPWHLLIFVNPILLGAYLVRFPLVGHLMLSIILFKTLRHSKCFRGFILKPQKQKIIHLKCITQFKCTVCICTDFFLGGAYFFNNFKLNINM